jgi:hypothetical protein
MALDWLLVGLYLVPCLFPSSCDDLTFVNHLDIVGLSTYLFSIPDVRYGQDMMAGSLVRGTNITLWAKQELERCIKRHDVGKSCSG